MTTVSLAGLRSRPYETYATQHAGEGSREAVGLVCQRDMRPLLPPPAAGPVDELVEQASRLLHEQGVTATLGDARARPAHGEHAIGHELATILEKVA